MNWKLQNSKERTAIITAIRECLALGVDKDDVRRPKTFINVKCSSNGQDPLSMAITAYSTRVEELKQYLEDTPNDAFIDIASYDDEPDSYYISVLKEVSVSDNHYLHHLRQILNKISNEVDITYNGKRMTVSKEVALYIEAMLARN
jgi:CRP-like cAMP-binding protein